ncbi:MAG: hypothetical protein Q9P14_07730 [candidate division KSB1 bacterium]|nr:hypothetical protein [candidate division KSB1 bacterium]
MNLQEITDKVGLGLLSPKRSGSIIGTNLETKARYLPQRPFYPLERIIKAEVQRIETGSFFEKYWVCYCRSNGGSKCYRFILQNLGAKHNMGNWRKVVFWGIKEKVVPKPNRFRWFHRDVDPVEIGPNLREVLPAIALTIIKAEPPG